MKTKILGSILLPIVLFAVPYFAHAAAHVTGTNILNSGTIYMVSTDSRLRPYTSAGAFLSYGFNSWNNVQQVNSDDLALPIGEFIPPRDGKIICSDRGTDKGTCYLITNSMKAGFTDELVFKGLGFNFKNTLSGDVSFLPTTANIRDATSAHLSGTLVNDNGTIKIMTTGGTVGIPSMNVLLSWGYALTDVVAANSADQSLTQIAVLPNHTAGELAWSQPSKTSSTPPSTPTPSYTPSTSSSSYTPPMSTPSAVDSNPFAGNNPYLLFQGQDAGTDKIHYDIAIELITPQTLADQDAQVYSFWCTTPNNTAGINFTTNGVYYYESNTIYSSIYPVDLGIGHYSCKFRYKEGMYLSNPINFDFDGTSVTF